MSVDVEADIAAIRRIDAVPTILEVICRMTGMGFAAVARVTNDRWIACAMRDQIAFGLTPGGELELETTICNEIRQSGEGVVIDHVADDESFKGHPTPAQYGFQSYISMPIFRADKSFFGTLCAIDPNPARINTPEIISMFRLFGELIAAQLDAQDRLDLSNAALTVERQEGELREQFISVLGHDLRNPVASLRAGLRTLEAKPKNPGAVLSLMQSTVDRMAELVDNMLDLARGRRGGLRLNRVSNESLSASIRGVVGEFNATSPIGLNWNS